MEFPTLDSPISRVYVFCAYVYASRMPYMGISISCATDVVMILTSYGSFEIWGWKFNGFSVVRDWSHSYLPVCGLPENSLASQRSLAGALHWQCHACIHHHTCMSMEIVAPRLWTVTSFLEGMHGII